MAETGEHIGADGGVQSFQHGYGVAHARSVGRLGAGAKFFRCVRAALGKSFPRMADSIQRADTGASFRQCLLELKWMVATWVVFFAWVIGYSSVAGYAAAEQAEVQMVWGIPRWVFFGWVIPLLVANVFTIWFCLCKMQDEPMEELPEDTP